MEKTGLSGRFVMRHSRALLAALLLALGMCGSLGAARAQSYPNRTITMVVPFPPGGSTSIVGRIIADKMSELLGQSIVVDNRGGAGGTVGSKSVAKSEPDGYTLLLGYTGTLAIAPSLYRNAGYDPRKDFEPIGMIGSSPSSLVVHPSFPAKTVAEFVAYAKANPGKVNFGSAGIGTVGHITGEYFAQATGIKIVHIPYKGTGPAISDLLGGHIPMSFSPIATTAGNVNGGLLRALAVTSAHRNKLLPEVIDRLNEALRDALASDAVKKQLELDGTEITPSTPQQYADFIDQDEKKWSELVKASGVEPE
jgi:tripartite-type tricarboxylate transporter receptor subunit TctC